MRCRRRSRAVCVLKGSDDDVEGRQHDRAVPVMGVGPPGSPCRRGTQTTAVSCRSRAGVRSDCGEGPLSAGQVCDEKTNVCEPLLTHREIERWHQNRGRPLSPGQRRVRSGSPSARELPACGPGGARCRGGVSSSQALAWNRRTCRPDTDLAVHLALVPPGRREGGPRAADTVSGRVPTRGTGADRPVVVVKAL